MKKNTRSQLAWIKKKYIDFKALPAAHVEPAQSMIIRSQAIGFELEVVIQIMSHQGSEDSELA